MPTTLPWFIAALAAAAGLGLLIGLLVQRRRRKPPALPVLWSLTPRPVFSTEERALFRQLREALPDHVVLSKLPLVRFCQPADPQQVRYWYDLLGHGHVSFAICSINGRVLAAIDVDGERSSRRSQQIKESVLNACRVRYVRCAADQVLSLPEIQALVPVVVKTPSRAARRLAARSAAAPAAVAVAAVASAPAPIPAAAPAPAPAPLPAANPDPLAMWQQVGTPPQDAFYGFDDDGRPFEGAVVVDGPLAPLRR